MKSTKTIIFMGIFLCSLVMFMPKVMAAAPSIGSRNPSYQYFDSLSSYSSPWASLLTPEHYVIGTDPERVAYCLQNRKDSPDGGDVFNADEYLNELSPTVKKGLLIILENGYPYSTKIKNFSLTPDEARYATANAIRFWLAESRNDDRYDENYTSFDTLDADTLRKDAATGQIKRVKAHKSTYTKVLQYAIELLIMGREGYKPDDTGKLIHDIAFTNPSNGTSIGSLSLSLSGEYFVGQIKIKLTNFNYGYKINSQLPAGSYITGYTGPGKNGDVLTVYIPKNSNWGGTYQLTVDGFDDRTDDNMKAYAAKSSNIQAVVTVFKGTANVAKSATLTITTPDAPSKQLPNLKPSLNLGVSYNPGETVVIKALVTNNGTVSTAKSFYMKLVPDARYYSNASQEKSTSSLSNGGVLDSNGTFLLNGLFSNPYIVPNAPNGTQICFKLIADSKGEITESNEGDNTAQACFIVTNKPDCPVADPDPVKVTPNMPIKKSKLSCDPLPSTSYNPPTYTVGYKENAQSSSFYCSTTCRTENMTLNATFQHKQSVFAGTGFEYPVSFGGTRACNFNFTLNDLARDINKTVGILTSTDYNQSGPNCIKWKNHYIKLVGTDGVLNYCTAGSLGDLTGTDNFKILPPSSVSGTATGGDTDPVKYVQATNTSTFQKTNTQTGSANINFCKNEIDCSSSTTSHVQYDTSWKLSSTLSASYTLAHTCVDMFTGDLTTTGTACGEKTYDGGNKYYTGFYQKTGNYNFDVSASLTIGRYIRWNINDDCSYDVDNRIFPPKGDIHYPKWGGTAFTFREISLTNPFPVLAPKANWIGHEDDIDPDTYKKSPEYVMCNLTPSIMHQIMGFNKTSGSYTTFNFSVEGGKVKSAFIWETYKDLFCVK